MPFLEKLLLAVPIVAATILNKGLEYFLFLVTMQGKELDLQYVQDIACEIYSVFSESCPFLYFS